MDAVKFFVLVTILQVILLRVQAVSKTRDTLNGFTYINLIQHNDHKLAGTSLKVMHLNFVFDCLLACNVEGSCISANINTTSDNQGLIHCELLDTDHYEFKEKLHAVKGIDYYTMPFDSSLPLHCAAIKKANSNAASGVYRITTTPSRSVQVYCDMVTSGGGWTVFQKRLDGSVDFYRGWDDYRQGFGTKSGEYWLGLDRVHLMTSQVKSRLRIDMEDHEGNTTYAEYDTFSVADELTNYRLTIAGYSGNASDSLSIIHNNKQFSTKDRDNDESSSENCAQSYTGAWWYENCHLSNLNGLYGNTEFGKGIIWKEWKGLTYSLKRVEMKIRPIDF